MAKGRYRVLTGLDYEGKRAEPGDVVNDLPGGSIKWLEKGGYIEQVQTSSKTGADKTEEES